MSLPLPDQLLPPPPMSNAQTTAPFQQMLSAVVGKTRGRNSISLCASAGISKLQSIRKVKEEVGQKFLTEIPSKLISKKHRYKRKEIL